MIITDSQQLRELTGSFYANNDFAKIKTIIADTEADVARTVGLATLDNLDQTARAHACKAVAYMATMRFYQLNDLSHENSGRKAKIDRENEARPFEWQLARDDRAHLEAYYRALDRLIDSLQDNADYQLTQHYMRQQALIVRSADCLSFLTGFERSAWLFQRMIPFLFDSQLAVRRQFGAGDAPAWADLLSAAAEETPTAGGMTELLYSAQKAVALGAVETMARRTALQALPYGLMNAVESDGGGNTRQQPTAERLEIYLAQLHRKAHHWTAEMQRLRDEMRQATPCAHLNMPDNSDPRQSFFRL